MTPPPGWPAAFDAVEGEQWLRRGRRSDGARFSIAGFSRYLLHDPVHHLYDVTGDRGALTLPRTSRPQSGSSRADPGSRWMVACGIVRSAEAGHAVVIGPVRAAATGSALRASGTMAEHAAGAQKRRDRHGDGVGRDGVEVGEVALVTCCMRQAASSSTTLTS